MLAPFDHLCYPLGYEEEVFQQMATSRPEFTPSALENTTVSTALVENVKVGDLVRENWYKKRPVLVSNNQKLEKALEVILYAIIHRILNVLAAIQ
jgi:hypothetical protein